MHTQPCAPHTPLTDSQTRLSSSILSSLYWRGLPAILFQFWGGTWESVFFESSAGDSKAQPGWGTTTLEYSVP